MYICVCVCLCVQEDIVYSEKMYGYRFKKYIEL